MENGSEMQNISYRNRFQIGDGSFFKKCFETKYFVPIAGMILILNLILKMEDRCVAAYDWCLYKDFMNCNS